jgi:glutamate synthase (NADPH/NADH) small chain
VLGINDRPVTIKQVEVEIIDRAWDEGWVDAAAAAHRKTGKRSPSSAPARPASPPRSS